MIEVLEPRRVLSAVSAAPDSYSVGHNQTLDVSWGGVLQNDSGSGGTMTASEVSGPSHGSLSLNSDGTFTYHADSGFAGVDSFTYAATIGDASDTASVSIYVTNSAPQANAAYYNTAFFVQHDHVLDVPYSVISAYDADGDATTQSVVSNVSHGSLDMHSDGTFQYTPDAGFTGIDRFSIQYTDALGAAGNVVDFTIGVTNSPPQANAPYYYTAFSVQHDHVLDVPYSVISAYDADGDATTQSVVSNVSHGTLDMHTDGTFQYTPDAGFTGIDRFSIQYTDTLGATSNIVDFTISVTNSAPYANAQYYNTAFSIPHDHVLNVPYSVISAYDADGDATTQSVVSNVSHGTLDMHADGTFQYTPDAGFTGVDRFSIQYTDTLGATSNIVDFTISVTNSAPSANSTNSYFTVSHDHVLDVPYSVMSAYDPDGDTMTQTLVTNVVHGALTQNPNGTFQYTPTAGYTGSDSFTVKYVDSLGASSNLLTFAINVTNSAPNANSNSSYFTVSHDHVLDVPYSVMSAYDPDGDTMTPTVVTNVAHGSLTLNPNGGFQYTPTAGYTGTDSFSVEYVDSLGASSSPLNFTINVTESAPVANSPLTSFTVTHDQELDQTTPVISGYDADGDFLTQVLVSNVSHGTLDLHPDGSFEYTPTPGYAGTDSFSVKYVDTLGVASNVVAFAINVVNTPPTATGDSYFDFATGSPNLSVTAADGVLKNDSDPDTPENNFSAILVSQASNGWVSLSGDGSFTYTLENTSFAGDDTFTYKVSDGIGESSTVTVTIQVAQLRIKDGEFAGQFGNDVTDQTIATIDGKRNLRVVALENGHGHSIGDVNWAIGGDAIANYNVTTNTVTELTSNELSATSVEWCWVAESDTQGVSVTATVDGISATVSTYFDITRPTATVQDIPMQDPSVFTRNGVLCIGLGTSGNNPGITLTPEGDGSFKWIQILDNTYGTREKNGYVEYFNHSDLYDSTSTATYPGGLEALKDSPRDPLPLDWDSYSRADQFTAYLMFKPTGADIYIPAGKVDWQWSGSASKDANGNYILNDSSKSRSELLDQTSYPPDCAGYSSSIVTNRGWQPAS